MVRSGRSGRPAPEGVGRDESTNTSLTRPTAYGVANSDAVVAGDDALALELSLSPEPEQADNVTSTANKTATALVGMDDLDWDATAMFYWAQQPPASIRSRRDRYVLIDRSYASAASEVAPIRSSTSRYSCSRPAPPGREVQSTVSRGRLARRRSYTSARRR